MITKQAKHQVQATTNVEYFANYVIHDCLMLDTELGIRLDLELRIQPHSFYYYVRKNKEVVWKGQHLDIAVAEYNKLLQAATVQLPAEDPNDLPNQSSPAQ